MHPGASAIDLQRFFDLSPDLLCVAGVDGYFRHINPAGVRLLGYRLEDLFQQPFVELIHPDDRAATLRAIETIEQGETLIQFENRYRCGDGSFRWISWNASPATGEGLIYAVGRDVTRQKELDQQARDREERIELAVRGGAEGLWDWGRDDAERQWWSPSFYALMGYQDQEVPASKTTFLQMMHPDDRERYNDLLRSHFSRNTPYDIEARFLTNDRGYRWFQVSAKAYRNSEGQVFRVAGSMRDVDERRQMQRALERREEMLRHAGEMAKVGGWELDLETMAAQWSSEACEILGTQSQLSLDDAVKLFDSDAVPVFWEAIRNAVERWAPFDLEFPLTTLTKRYIWVRAIGRVKLDNGRPISLTGAIQDISEIKASKDLLQRYLIEAEEAHQRVEEQASQLIELAADTERARAAAEESTRLKSEFLANMSHEIRTPMNGILGMAHLLEDTTLSDEQDEYLYNIRLSAESLLAIINDILDLSKIEAGRLEFEAIEFDLEKCVEDAALVLSQNAQDKGVELSTFIEPNSRRVVVGDPTRVRQILVNLLSNAVKFTAQGEVHVEVTVESEDAEDAMIRFGVRDSGIGIPAEAQDKLFEAFTQADGSTTRKYGGTGLGLTICRQLAETMGGEIGVISSLGQGSTFWFTTRLRKAKAAPRPDCPVSGQVLVLAPQQALRGTLAAYLGEAGATVCTPLDAREAESDAQLVDFDCIVVDANFDNGRGLDFARQLVRPGAQLVLLTAAGGVLDSPCRQRLGIAAALTKPIRRQNLLAALDTSSTSETLKPCPQPPSLAGSLIGLRVLVAEDNRINQKVARKMLEKLGCDPTTADNGRIAVEAIKTNEYDVVLMDCQMPEMDGFEATRIIRELEGEHARLPIVALTANAMQGDRERCLHAGMDDYLTKPIQLKALSDTLERWQRDSAR